jgi:hypothetical protein
MAHDSDNVLDPSSVMQFSLNRQIEKGVKERDELLRLAAAQLAMLTVNRGLGRSITGLLSYRDPSTDPGSEADFIEGKLTENERDALHQATFVVQAIYKASQIKFPTNEEVDAF